MDVRCPEGGRTIERKERKYHYEMLDFRDMSLFVCLFVFYLPKDERLVGLNW